MGAIQQLLCRLFFLGEAEQMTSSTEQRHVLARYEVGVAALTFGGWTIASAALGASLLWPTPFMQQRPIFSALLVLVFAASLLFVGAFVRFLLSVFANDRAAVFVQKGRLATIAGSVALSDIAEVITRDTSGGWIEIRLKSGKMHRFGVTPLEGNAPDIAEAIRNAMSTP